MIYLDNAATTRVADKYMPYIYRILWSEYGNPGSLHRFGKEAGDLLDRSRKRIAKTLLANENNVIFTSSGSEANTLAILGLEKYLRETGKTHVVTSTYEHHSVLNSFKRLEEHGFSVSWLDPVNGCIPPAKVKNAICDKTGLVSIMYVNNEIGSMNDVAAIYRICAEEGVLFHSDCVQAMGTVAVSTKIADAVTISGHKIHAPKGSACLCTNYYDVLENIICGGGQEFGLRPGTENVAAAYALGRAVMDADFAARNTECVRYINNVTGSFLRKLRERCEKEDFDIYIEVSDNMTPSYKIMALVVDGVEAETLVVALGEAGLCVSSGAACTKGSEEPSHVLKAIGMSDEEARSTIRVSFSDDNTEEEAAAAAEILVDTIKKLKSV